LGDLPKEVKALIGLKVVDAELVMHPVPFLWLFDLPQAKGRLRERRNRLSDRFAKISEKNWCPHIRMMPLLPKRTAYQDALLAGEEGVVWKKLSSLYVMQMEPDNEISDWIKMKPAEKW
jgi:ATP-dependent DNA ligase